MSHHLDILAFKMDSSDTEIFVADVLTVSRNAAVLVFDFDKISFRARPDDLSGWKKDHFFFKSSDAAWNYRLAPLVFFVNMILLGWIFMRLCVVYRPRVTLAENTFAAVFLGFYKRLGFVKKAIYIPGDWLVSSAHTRIFSNIANNVIFPWADYLACRWSDLVLHHTPLIAQARKSHWKRDIVRKEMPYAFKPIVKADTNGDFMTRSKKNLCFIGQIRQDSGLDTVLRALPEIRKSLDINLVLIGPSTHDYERIQAMTLELGLQGCVHFKGFLDADAIKKEAAHCFCGINLLALETYSSYTIPGKMMHYIQYLLPVITTRGVGYFAGIVREYRLGLVIEPGTKNFTDAVFDIYKEQKRYRENILAYIHGHPDIHVKDYINACQAAQP
jgi:glycosyltransferase involved in cell wall biosynthesis